MIKICVILLIKNEDQNLETCTDSFTEQDLDVSCLDSFSYYSLL